jgi:hypothetical protein
MTWDPLLSDDLPTVWVPFGVEVRPDGDRLELFATGHLDGWTAGALLRNLIAVCEPNHTEVHLDLEQVSGTEAADDVLARCRAFAESRRIRFRVTAPAWWALAATRRSTGLSPGGSNALG